MALITRCSRCKDVKSYLISQHKRTKAFPGKRDLQPQGWTGGRSDGALELLCTYLAECFWVSWTQWKSTETNKRRLPVPYCVRSTTKYRGWMATYWITAISSVLLFFSKLSRRLRTYTSNCRTRDGSVSDGMSDCYSLSFSFPQILVFRLQKTFISLLALLFRVIYSCVPTLIKNFWSFSQCYLHLLCVLVNTMHLLYVK